MAAGLMVYDIPDFCQQLAQVFPRHSRQLTQMITSTISCSIDRELVRYAFLDFLTLQRNLSLLNACKILLLKQLRLVAKFEIQISKSETNPNDKNPKLLLAVAGYLTPPGRNS